MIDPTMIDTKDFDEIRALALRLSLALNGIQHKYPDLEIQPPTIERVDHFGIPSYIVTSIPINYRC